MDQYITFGIRNVKSKIGTWLCK